jgi:hypothetical protein
MSLHYNNMLSSSRLHRNKKVLARNGGGGIGKEMYLKPILYGRVSFEHDTISLALCLGWKILFSLDHIPL